MSYQNLNSLENISVSMNSETKSFLLRFFPEKVEQTCLTMLRHTCLLLSMSFLELSLFCLGRKKKVVIRSKPKHIHSPRSMIQLILVTNLNAGQSDSH